MAWIKSHQSLARHRKTLRAARLLGLHRQRMIGLLHELWWWALDNVPADGSLDSVSADDLADVVEWEKDPVTLETALVEAGFIDAEPRQFHDWPEYTVIRRRSGYRRFLQVLFDRDGDTCQLCGLPLPGDHSKIHVDHVLPVSLGGGDEVDNLRLAHASCNSSRGNRL